MIRSFSAALAAVLTFALAAVSFAQPGVSQVSPAQGTVGTQITITGAELGTAKPKVALQLHGDATAKPIPLKLAAPFDGTTIHATVAKIQPGVYDLVVTPKGGSAITVMSAFTGEAPSISGLSAGTIAPGDHVDITGTFFGTLKGKVTIGGVTAKVIFWSDAKITVVVSKKNQSGSATFDILGKGGTQTAGATANVVAPITGGDHFKATFDAGGSNMNATDSKLTFWIDNGGSTFTINAGQKFGSGLSTNYHTFTIAVGGPISVNTFTAGSIVVAYTEAGIAARQYSSQGAGGWTINVVSHVGNRISGTFSGGLSRASGSGASTYNVSGEFILTLKQ
jgi:hypothetical protein